MSAHLSRLRLFQRHLRSLVWVWVWVWDWIHWHTSPRTRSPSSRHPPFTHYPSSPRSLVCGGQTSPHKLRLVVSHRTCLPLSSSIKTVLTQSAQNRDFSRQRNQTPHKRARYRSWGSLKMNMSSTIRFPPRAHSFVLGTAVINNNNTLTIRTFLFFQP